jgi:predicted nucleic-acid-binding Zn-ribbon protein
MIEKSAKIVKRKNEYCVISEGGRNMGCYPSRSGAEKRLKQVEMFKHMKKKNATYHSAALEALFTGDTILAEHILTEAGFSLEHCVEFLFDGITATSKKKKKGPAIRPKQFKKKSKDPGLADGDKEFQNTESINPNITTSLKPIVLEKRALEPGEVDRVDEQKKKEKEVEEGDRDARSLDRGDDGNPKDPLAPKKWKGLKFNEDDGIWEVYITTRTTKTFNDSTDALKYLKKASLSGISKKAVRILLAPSDRLLEVVNALVDVGVVPVNVGQQPGSFEASRKSYELIEDLLDKMGISHIVQENSKDLDQIKQKENPKPAEAPESLSPLTQETNPLQEQPDLQELPGVESMPIGPNEDTNEIMSSLRLEAETSHHDVLDSDDIWKRDKKVDLRFDKRTNKYVVSVTERKDYEFDTEDTAAKFIKTAFVIVDEPGWGESDPEFKAVGKCKQCSTVVFSDRKPPYNPEEPRLDRQSPAEEFSSMCPNCGYNVAPESGNPSYYWTRGSLSKKAAFTLSEIINQEQLAKYVIIRFEANPGDVASYMPDVPPHELATIEDVVREEGWVLDAAPGAVFLFAPFKITTNEVLQALRNRLPRGTHYIDKPYSDPDIDPAGNIGHNLEMRTVDHGGGPAKAPYKLVRVRGDVPDNAEEARKIVDKRWQVVEEGNRDARGHSYVPPELITEDPHIFHVLAPSSKEVSELLYNAGYEVQGVDRDRTTAWWYDEKQRLYFLYDRIKNEFVTNEHNKPIYSKTAPKGATIIRPGLVPDDDSVQPELPLREPTEEEKREDQERKEVAKKIKEEEEAKKKKEEEEAAKKKKEEGEEEAKKEEEEERNVGIDPVTFKPLKPGEKGTFGSETVILEKQSVYVGDNFNCPKCQQKMDFNTQPVLGTPEGGDKLPGTRSWSHDSYYAVWCADCGYSAAFDAGAEEGGSMGSGAPVYNMESNPGSPGSGGTGNSGWTATLKKAVKPRFEIRHEGGEHVLYENVKGEKYRAHRGNFPTRQEALSRQHELEEKK